MDGHVLGTLKEAFTGSTVLFREPNEVPRSVHRTFTCSSENLRGFYIE